MTFEGFGADALPFFKALAFHQSREWFEANRGTYETRRQGADGRSGRGRLGGPRKAKIPIKGDRKSSLFRIHRDVRFSRNKDPYKTNAGVALTRSGAKGDPGVLYFICRPRNVSSPRASICPIRAARADRDAAARAPRRSSRWSAKLEGGPRAVRGGCAEARAARLRRRPRSGNRRGDPAQKHDLPEAGRGSGDQVSGLADDFCAFAKDALPLLQWGWDALADSR